MTDRRLLRAHPDLLPTHRLCRGCSKIKPLDSDHFYETTRYPWNLSRFAPSCIECCKLADRVRYAQRKAERNARRLERSRIVRADMRQMGSEAYAKFQAVKEAKRTEGQARKELIASLKRGLLRKYGPRPDGIKLLIAERSRMYARARLTSGVEPPEFRSPPQNNSSIENIRARHNAEAANRSP